MKKFFNWLLKAFAAGLIALAVLCALCLLYYNVPVHYTNTDGSTEYKWEPNTFYSRGTEGFALGKTNNDGFNNLRDYTPGEKIDVLLLGSSHMEGFNVAQDENTAAVMNKLFAGEKYVYNIGTAAHTLAYCIKHLSAALDTYAPESYAVLETNTVNFSAQTLEAVADGTLADIPSHNGGLTALVQKLPYLRLAYMKLNGTTGGVLDIDNAIALEQTQIEDYAAALRPMLELAAEAAEAHGVKLIIAYDPIVLVNDRGEAYTGTDPECLRAFEELCAELDIAFTDATDCFVDFYARTARLPYGFSNTEPGIGHINRDGHRLFAGLIYDSINSLEGAA